MITVAVGASPGVAGLSAPASAVALLSARADTITDGGKTEGERRQGGRSADTVAISACDLPCASHLVALL